MVSDIVATLQMSLFQRHPARTGSRFPPSLCLPQREVQLTAGGGGWSRWLITERLQLCSIYPRTTRNYCTAQKHLIKPAIDGKLVKKYAEIHKRRLLAPPTKMVRNTLPVPPLPPLCSSLACTALRARPLPNSSHANHALSQTMQLAACTLSAQLTARKTQNVKQVTCAHSLYSITATKVIITAIYMNIFLHFHSKE